MWKLDNYYQKRLVISQKCSVLHLCINYFNDKNRTWIHPGSFSFLSNSLPGLSAHCRFFYSILFIKNTKTKDNMANLWCCLLDEYFDYYFHSRLLIWISLHSSSIGMVCWFNYYMPTSFFPQTYSDNGWLQSTVLN